MPRGTRDLHQWLHLPRRTTGHATTLTSIDIIPSFVAGVRGEAFVLTVCPTGLSSAATLAALAVLCPQLEVLDISNNDQLGAASLSLSAAAAAAAPVPNLSSSSSSTSCHRSTRAAATPTDGEVSVALEAGGEPVAGAGSLEGGQVQMAETEGVGAGAGACARPHAAAESEAAAGLEAAAEAGGAASALATGVGGNGVEDGGGGGGGAVTAEAGQGSQRSTDGVLAGGGDEARGEARGAVLQALCGLGSLRVLYTMKTPLHKVGGGVSCALGMLGCPGLRAAGHVTAGRRP